MRTLSTATLLVGLIVCASHNGRAQTRDVQTFIAAAGFPKEHSAAIQSGIDKAEPGAVIYFPPGIYRFARPLRLKSSQTYRGSKSAILKPASGRAEPVFQLENTSSVSIRHLTFQGGGIVMSGRNTESQIVRNTFQDIFDPSGPFGKEVALFIAGPVSHAVIEANTFKRIGLRNGRSGAKNGAALLAYHLDHTLISNNQFSDVYQAVSLIFEGKFGSGNSVAVTGNHITNAVRMGIEAQGRGTRGARFEANTIIMDQIGSEDIGLSVVLTGGINTIVNGNKIERKMTSTKSCAGMGIEVAGINTRVEDNDIRGPWCSAIGISSEGAQFSHIVGNRICGHRAKYNAISFYNDRGASTAERNTNQATCK